MTEAPEGQDDFEAEDLRTEGAGAEKLVVNIEGFEGPLDLLLVLARGQKVDLKQISISALVDQYLVFINEARRLRLELAADYLVMAAWLAYLKSRLLLPEPEDADQPSAEELASRLQFQLQKLGALREVSAQLMSHDRLGRDVFARGNPEGVVVFRNTRIDLSLYDLLKVYAEHTTRHALTEMHIPRLSVYSIEEAFIRLERLLGEMPDWVVLEHFLPETPGGAVTRRSARASMFVACLELARQGKTELRQMEPFGPLYLRSPRGEAGR
jgi:segregation and condensation protein A